MISHCSFDLHLIWTSFHVFISHLYVFFGGMSVQVFCPLFDWVVCLFVGIDLHELLVYFGDYSLPVVSFAIVFSHSEGCVFTFLQFPLLCKSFFTIGATRDEDIFPKKCLYLF